MDLARQIRSAIIACQPLDSKFEEVDFIILTNMILSVLSRNKLITAEQCLEWQLPIPKAALVIKLDLYERLWDLLEGVDDDPTDGFPLECSNREEEE